MSQRDRFTTLTGLTHLTRLNRLAGLVPARGSTAARTPFVLLVVVLLGAGMVALLILNASLNQGSFELSELRRETQELTDEQQRLQAEVDAYSAPGALAERAEELGLVPAGPPAFLGPEGELLGDTSPTPAPEPVRPAEPADPGAEGTRGTGEDDQPAEPAEQPTEVVPQGGATGSGQPATPSAEPAPPAVPDDAAPGATGRTAAPAAPAAPQAPAPDPVPPPAEGATTP